MASNLDAYCSLSLCQDWGGSQALSIHRQCSEGYSPEYALVSHFLNKLDFLCRACVRWELGLACKCMGVHVLVCACLHMCAHCQVCTHGQRCM